MAILPAPRTWTIGELLTAAKLNLDLRDGLNFLLAPPRVALQKSINQTISNNLFTIVLWDVELVDSDSGHSLVSNTGRYTAQTAGWFDFVAMGYWSSDSSVGTRVVALNRNGSSTGWQANVGLTTTNSCLVPMSGFIFLNVGDYIEFLVFHDSGSNRLIQGGSTGSQFCVIWRSKT